MAPRISTANFASDWRRLEYFREVNELPEKEVLCQLPFLLEDQLFVPYINSCQRLKLASVAEAEKLLLSLAGVRKNSYSDFMARVWKRGQETLTQFMCTLQNIAAILDLPSGLVKSQFLNGIPEEVAREIKILDSLETSCDAICQMAERVLQFKPKASIDIAANDNSVLETIKVLQEEINALKLSSQARVVCFNCRKEGHVARNCRNKRPIKCYTCGKTGHTKAQCPKN